MTCTHSDLKAKLYEYWDGELTSSEADKVAAHLKACTDCSKEYKHWQSIKEAFFKPLSISSLSDDLSDRVMAQIQNKKSAETFSVKEFIKWAVPSLGLVFGTLLFFAIMPLSEEAPFSAGSFLAQSDDSLQMMLGIDGNTQSTDWYNASEENL